MMFFKYVGNKGFGENLFKVAVGSAVKMTEITDVPRKGLPPCRFYVNNLLASHIDGNYIFTEAGNKENKSIT